ncbi:response regulator [Candidatus Omnitrophota bacterium]
MTKARILLIDDEPVFCSNFKTFMQMHKYECHIAVNGKEGMEKIRAEKPELVVLDILMPNMDGYTMLRELKKNNISVPCIILTAREKLKDLFEMESVSRFISKPIEMSALKKIIDNVLKEEKEKSMNKGEDKDKVVSKKVLIIEDDKVLADNIKSYLELKGYLARAAYDGVEGLNLCETFSPDLVLSDVMMPEMDGFSMLKQLQKIRADIPVIILTGKDKLKDLFEVEGIQAFLTKPFDMAELEEKIRTVLSNGE